MKKLMLGFIGALLAACATERNGPSVPDEAMVDASGESAVTLQRGRAVYMSDCARCHDAKMPKEISSEDWHVILPGMAWNAGISKADEDAVEAYIKAVLAQ
ncbi:hypothetical protein ACFQY0_17210 [Haloferula chungangensis]|uniref:Cytochrome c domain-containing protein n=1 Tax=Haloferula chungangensis TaxID=1048331 RepID=A0ABW2L934_9BACT